MTSLMLSSLLGPESEGTSEKIKLITSLQERGLYVFPLCGFFRGLGTCGRPGESAENAGKHPVKSSGMTLASLNAEAVTTYFTEHPYDNVAIHCKDSQLVVIDIDTRHDGHNSWEVFVQRFGLDIPETVEVLTGLTPSASNPRGRHLYFRYSGTDTFLGGLESFGLSGVDIKHNGYVVAPPSTHHSGVNYEFAEGKGLSDLEIADLPEALTAILKRQDGEGIVRDTASPFREPPKISECLQPTTPYGASALKGEVERVLSSTEGSRNKTLYSAGVRLASLVAGGEISFSDVEKRLIPAAEAVGLEYPEINSTLYREGGAFDIGAMKPSSSPVLPESLLQWAKERPANTTAETDVEHSKFLLRAHVVDLEEMFGDHEPERWFIPGFICEGRGHALLSVSGVGKSLLMRELAAKLALGESIWGYPAQAPIRVLYLDYENDPIQDIGATLKEMQLNLPAKLDGQLTFLSYPEFGTFDTDEGASDIERALDIFKPDLVIIDTLSRVVAGEENSNDTWLNFYRSVGMVFKRRGVTYVRIDHLGKNAERGARGGSAKTGDIDLIWTLDGDSDGKMFTLKNSKSRTFLKEKNLVLERRSNPLQHVVVHKAEVPWDSLFKSIELREKLEAWLSELDSRGQLKGQSATWSAHKEELERMGVTKAQLEAGHRAYRGEHPLS
jgi:hypothetical protein